MSSIQAASRYQTSSTSNSEASSSHLRPMPRLRNPSIRHNARLMSTYFRPIVSASILRFNPRKSPGTDHIHPLIVESCVVAFSEAFSVIFSSRIPDAWKLAQISIIFKKGSRSSPGNYGSIRSVIVVPQDQNDRLRLLRQ